MKSFAHVIKAAAVVVLAAACSKNEIAENNVEAQEEGVLTSVSVKASIEGEDTKAAIDGTSGAFTWSEGDKIAVHTTGTNGWYVSDPLTAGQAGSKTANFNVSIVGTRNYFAVYPASLVYDEEGGEPWPRSKTYYGWPGVYPLIVNLPDQYEYAEVSGNKNPGPMIAVNNPASGYNELCFKHICGLLRLTISNVPASTSYIKIDFCGMRMTGEFQVAKDALDPGSAGCVISGQDGYSSSDCIKITGVPSGTFTVNIPLPTNATYKDIRVSAWNSSNNPVKGAVIPFGYASTRARGKKIAASLDKGVFLSQSSWEMNYYVMFSPGNLQATTTDFGASWNWHFAEHQYDVIRVMSANQYINGVGTVSVNGTVDLFRWSSTDNTSYGIQLGSYTGEGRGSFRDWRMAVGEYKAGTWRGVTAGAGELASILNNHQLIKAQILETPIGTVYGLVILPVGWEKPTNCTYTTYAIGDPVVPFTTNSFYSTAASGASQAWCDMEAAGAVFLPCGGMMNGTEWINGVNGIYWHSGAEVSASAAFRTSLHNDTDIIAAESLDKAMGASVRLVTSIQ